MGRKGRSKDGIDQLNTAAGREYLGTYINKFLIINSSPHVNNKLLAQERNICVIELTKSPGENIDLSDKETLVEMILSRMS